MGGGTIDRRFWELCAMAELKNRLRAGDVWVDGSRRYRSLDDDLLPLDRAREQLATADPVMHDSAAFLRDRKQQLAAALVEVERQAAGDQLPDAGIRNGRLAVAQLQASTPKEVTALSELLYGVLPRVRITDPLEEVDQWTSLTGCFAHLKTGLPPSEGRTLLTALLADGINMGLKRMPSTRPGATSSRLVGERAHRAFEPRQKGRGRTRVASLDVVEGRARVGARRHGPEDSHAGIVPRLLRTSATTSSCGTSSPRSAAASPSSTAAMSSSSAAM